MELINDFSRASVALELMRHKALCDVHKGYTPSLGIMDINEILTVAGAPLIVPEEVNSKEVKVIKAEEK